MPNQLKGKVNSMHWVYVLALTSSLLLFSAITSPAQDTELSTPTRGKLASVEAAPELAWPLPPGVDKSYGSVDAKQLKEYVLEQAAISDKYRDLDPSNMWWGRIAGMPSGAAEQAWVEGKFKKIGIPFESHAIDMGAQDWPKSWSIIVSANGKSIPLKSSNPIIDFTTYMPSAQADEDLDAVWVGLGQPADFIGKDVSGKAVFIYSIASPSSLVQSAQWMGSVARAQKAGAKVVVVDLAIPGNWRYVSHMNGTSRDYKAGVFTIGDQDGTAVEELAASANGSLKVHVNWNVEHYPDLKEGIVVAKLDGMTDENIVMIAHTDGYFDAANDDGAGTAALLGTAEYFAKMPKEQRKRTMYFIATPDHHGGDHGGKWMLENLHSIFPKTAVIVNAEHVSVMNTVWDRKTWGTNAEPILVDTNSFGPSWWGVYGSEALAKIVRDDFALFGVPTQLKEGGSAGQLSRLQFQAPSFYLHNKGVYYHAENDTPAIVPEGALRNAVQAFAKIFNDINQLSLSDLQPPQSSKPSASIDAGN